MKKEGPYIHGSFWAALWHPHVFVFIITAIIGGLRYVFEKGFTGLGTDTVFYSLSICIILSMIIYIQYDIIKEKL